MPPRSAGPLRVNCDKKPADIGRKRRKPQTELTRDTPLAVLRSKTLRAPLGVQNLRRIVIVRSGDWVTLRNMKKIAIGCGVLLVLGIIVLVIAAIAGGSYNGLVKKSQQVDSAWAQVQTDYQRRADLDSKSWCQPSPARKISRNRRWWKSLRRGRPSARSLPAVPPGANRSGQTCGIRSGAEPSFVRAVATARGGGALSRPQSEQQFCHVAGATGRDGKSHCRGAPGFQRSRSKLRYRHEVVSSGFLRRTLWALKRSLTSRQPRIGNRRPGAIRFQ